MNNQSMDKSNNQSMNNHVYYFSLILENKIEFNVNWSSFVFKAEPYLAHQSKLINWFWSLLSILSEQQKFLRGFGSFYSKTCL